MSLVGGLPSLAEAGARPATATLSWALWLLRLRAGSVLGSEAVSPSPPRQGVRAVVRPRRLQLTLWVPACPHSPRYVCCVLNYDVPPEAMR